MSAEAVPDTAPATNTGTQLPDAADRGNLHIDSSVIRKIVEHTADQVPGTTTISRTLGSDRGAHAKVGGSGEVVDIDLDLGLSYPTDVRATVRRIRERVGEELSKTTGRRVRTLDVTVSALLPESTAEPRVQ